jgi:hypothetical protein
MDIHHFDVDAGNEVAVPKSWSGANSLAMVFTPDARRLIVSRDDGRIMSWDIASQAWKQTMARATKAVFNSGEPISLAVSPDGKTLLVGSGGMQIGRNWQGSPENLIAVYPLGDAVRNPDHFTNAGTVIINEGGGDVRFIVADAMLCFRIPACKLLPWRWDRSYPRIDQAEYAKAMQYRSFLSRLKADAQERNRVGITADQLQRLEKLPEIPTDPPRINDKKQKEKLEAMFVTFYKAAEGDARQKAAQPLIAMVRAESEAIVAQRDKFAKDFEKVLTPSQMQMLESAPDAGHK